MFAATVVKAAMCGRRVGSGTLPLSGLPAGRSPSFAADCSCAVSAGWLSANELATLGIAFGAGGVAGCPAALLASAMLAGAVAGAAIAGAAAAGAVMAVAAITGAAMVEDGVERVAAKGGGGTLPRAPAETGAGTGSAGATLTGAGGVAAACCI
jgi:hypothetical protein